MGERWLLVTCFRSDDAQFGGMLKVLSDPPAASAGLPWISWSGGSLEEPGLGASRLVLSGHGSPDAARVGDNHGRHLEPSLLGRAAASLYLLCCYQGQEALRRAWAVGAGLEVDEVHGAKTETETLLSTLFLLHLAVEGVAQATRWFDQWVLANHLIGPVLEEARWRYRRSGRNPIPVLDFLENAVNLDPVDEFLSLARRFPQYLTGIGA